MVLDMMFNFSSRPNRRFVFRLWGSMGIAALSAVVAGYATKTGFADGALVWVFALIPGLAMASAFYAVAMLIVEQKDEFIRMLVIRQLIMGTGVALSFAAIWGFLQNFELVDQITPLSFVAVFFGGFGLGGLVNRLTHGAWGEMS